MFFCIVLLEMVVLLLDIQFGDEVIMLSFMFVFIVNVFVLCGVKIVFVDICLDMMNIDEMLIEVVIIDKICVIVLVYYVGVVCEMDVIMVLVDKYNLFVVEDVVQGVMFMYKGCVLGMIGYIGCFSFYEIKNYIVGGEGGVMLINDCMLIECVEIICEKGINCSQFFCGQVDKYIWWDIGFSYLMFDLQVVYLWV